MERDKIQELVNREIDILRKMLEMKTTDRIEESLLWAYQLDIAEKSND